MRLFSGSPRPIQLWQQEKCFHFFLFLWRLLPRFRGLFCNLGMEWHLWEWDGAVKRRKMTQKNYFTQSIMYFKQKTNRISKLLSKENNNFFLIRWITSLKIHATKGQTKSKWFFQGNISSKKRTKEFDFTTMILQINLFLFVFLEEIEDTKKTFRNYLTFNTTSNLVKDMK